jgi:DNA-directed RNA polymerase specialized sigma24 family protein
VHESESAGHETVSDWIAQLKLGDQQAAYRLWKRFFGQLRAIARAKLGAFPRAGRDDEDLALSALNALFLGAKSGQFEQFETREDFWQLALVILSRKASNLRRAIRARREIVVTDLMSSCGMEDKSTIMEYAVQALSTETGIESLGIHCEELLASVDDRLRRVALLKLAGLSNEEIAASVDRSVKSVERYLQQIREAWTDAE